MTKVNLIVPDAGAHTANRFTGITEQDLVYASYVSVNTQHLQLVQMESGGSAAALANPLISAKLSAESPTISSNESRRNVLDEDLHSSVHRETKRYSFKMDEPSILVSEEDSLNFDNDEEDFAGTSAGAASFCDASDTSEADEAYLRRGISFSTDGNLIDFIEYYREEITGGVDLDDDHEGAVTTPDMIADRAVRHFLQDDYDDLSEDALEAEINRQLKEEEEALRKKDSKKPIDEEKEGTNCDAA